MNISEIENKIKSHEPQIIDTKRANAILIPLIETEDGVCLLFELRGEKVWQPGEVCFPGGGIEAGESVEQAACREANEEIGISPDDIEIMGRFDTVVGVGGMTLYTCVGKLNSHDFKPDPVEVAECFTVPLQYFIDTQPELYQFPVQIITPQDFDYSVFGVEGPYKWRQACHEVVSWNYNGYHIWGLTAKIVYSFIQSFF